jgi:hypothetical protein
LVIRRILDGIVKNRYHGNLGKLAAWATAGHIQKASKKKEEKPKQSFKLNEHKEERKMIDSLLCSSFLM